MIILVIAQLDSKTFMMSEENRDLSNEMESEFKRARSQYSAYTSMWAGKWMSGAQGADIKQEKAGLGETEASPTQSPYPAVSNTSSFPDTGTFPVTNYSNTATQQQQAAYSALSSHSGSGENTNVTNVTNVFTIQHRQLRYGFNFNSTAWG